jgi:8-oxo-dGTP pyrophosphatase MutT (NUDIX family)
VAALRECQEEAGIKVDLKGVLKFDHSVDGDQARMRAIFYAEPISIDEAHNFKTVPDEESIEARWVTIQEILELDQVAPGLRGDELL